MTANKNIQHSVLLSAVELDNGIFYLKKDLGQKRAGSCLTKRFKDTNYTVTFVPTYGTWGTHRLVWFYHYGQFPKCEIDHIDRNGLNNSIENLREATSGQNKQNRSVQRNSKTGEIGICFNDGSAKPFVAKIGFNKKRYSKHFCTLEEAKAWRLAMEEKFGFNNF